MFLEHFDTRRRLRFYITILDIKEELMKSTSVSYAISNFRLENIQKPTVQLVVTVFIDLMNQNAAIAVSNHPPVPMP